MLLTTRSMVWRSNLFNKPFKQSHIGLMGIWPDPRILAAGTKTLKFNDDNPSFDTAMHGPFQAKFWQAMRVELNTLENEFDCRELVPHPGNSKENNVLPSTWAFKIKRYPNGWVKKFKAWFCAWGNHQKEEINFLKLGLRWFNGQQSAFLWFLQQS